MNRMARIIASIAKYGISVTYRCKSIYAKYYGRRCKDLGTDECMRCKLCQAEMSAEDATRLLASFGSKVTRSET